ncbi:hypothetical protein ES703_117514 [subsurface metagenome]
MASSILAGFMLNVSASISTKTGIAFCINTGIAVPINVCAGTITSSPGPTLSAANARCIAATPLQVAKAYLLSKMDAYLSSNSFTLGPVMAVKRPSSNTAIKSFLSFSVNIGHLGKGLTRTGFPRFIASSSNLISPLHSYLK